jgi:glycosyltransferase involved in cell wall biosynthesis
VSSHRRELSVILPCYRAAPLARRSVAHLVDCLDRMFMGWELIVVDDGGKDFTGGEWTHPSVTLLRHDRNLGKGAAVRTGMLAASGDVRIFTDADLPFGTGLFSVMREYILHHGFHMVIGDRQLAGSSYRQEIGLTRKMASSVFTTLVGRVVTGGYFDTQCGLKAVRGDVADALFPLLRLNRFAFDVELVYVALKHQLDIKRVPVRLLHNETSSVRLARDAPQGMADVVRIKLNHMRGAYHSQALHDIVHHDFEAVRSGATANLAADGP